MANVFVNPYAGQGKAWSLQNCWLYMTGGEGTGYSLAAGNGESGVLAATQSVQIQYQRQINTRYPLMANKAPIKILGVPNGACTLGAILGPLSGVQQFLKIFGSTCAPFTLAVKQGSAVTSFDSQCEDQSTEHTITLQGCMGTQVTYTIQMQQNMAIAQGQFVLTFDKMDWSSK